MIKTLPNLPITIRTPGTVTPRGYVRQTCHTCGQPFYRRSDQAHRYDRRRDGKPHHDYCSARCFHEQAWGAHGPVRRCSRCTIPFDRGDFRQVPGKTNCLQCEREISLGVTVEIGNFIEDAGYFVRLGDMTERESIDQMADHANQPRRRGRPRGL